MYKYSVSLSIQIYTIFKTNVLHNDQKSKGCAKIKHFLLIYEQNSYLKDLNLISYTNDAYMIYNERQIFNTTVAEFIFS